MRVYMAAFMGMDKKCTRRLDRRRKATDEGKTHAIRRGDRQYDVEDCDE